MSPVKLIGILLIAGGVAGVVFTSFSYTKETHKAEIGPVELAVNEKETVNIPVWASVGAIVAGGLLLAFGGGRKG